ncbi:hypothetical protein [Cognaticolwellia beringensis]|uniref:SnoaL-like domain-containing protein n=1 Tax=Cognaticolwellia beringensis TaxID=1967665 RepID=A0A222G5W1_9GAMM|nr:hypothetical protein [Cognaticolwellia beringensis]ASP47286.1 hypothetical protein B5D82_05625 [Cognaticolwellia beringensis]
MYKTVIEQLFQRYIKAFHQKNMADTQTCYQLPCTLHTPDRVVLIESDTVFKREFIDIFTVLSHAEIKRFVALKASFSVLSENLVLACIDWQFIGPKDEVFTDFSAFYHLALSDGQWRIFNVVSQELSQSVALDTAFDIAYNTADADITPYNITQ